MDGNHTALNTADHTHSRELGLPDSQARAHQDQAYLTIFRCLRVGPAASIIIELAEKW